ncbi:hypothetical protein K438DRAFT_1962997 [Mycena galopus ATCC 62051]|nr:hypothetical protein K438DRAFT_1962997 [Mycena galopus ATCC 62051]
MAKIATGADTDQDCHRQHKHQKDVCVLAPLLTRDSRVDGFEKAKRASSAHNIFVTANLPEWNAENPGGRKAWRSARQGREGAQARQGPEPKAASEATAKSTTKAKPTPGKNAAESDAEGDDAEEEEGERDGDDEEKENNNDEAAVIEPPLAPATATFRLSLFTPPYGPLDWLPASAGVSDLSPAAVQPNSMASLSLSSSFLSSSSVPAGSGPQQSNG